MWRLILLNAAIWSGVAVAAERTWSAATAPEPAPGAIAVLRVEDGGASIYLPAPPPASLRAALDDRPPFSPLRRPYAPISAAADTPPPVLTLVGVMGMGEARIALVRDAGGAIHRLAPGAAVDGWAVRRVAPRQLTLTRAGQDAVVQLGVVAPAADEASAAFVPDAGPGPAQPPRTGRMAPLGAPIGNPPSDEFTGHD